MLQVREGWMGAGNEVTCVACLWISHVVLAVLWASQGVVTYMLPAEAFVTGIKTYDWQKVCWLIILFWSFWSLHFQWVKGQILAVRSWSIDFCSLEVTLIPWSDVKKGLIQFWFHSQTLLHEIYKWLRSLCKQQKAELGPERRIV